MGCHRFADAFQQCVTVAYLRFDRHDKAFKIVVIMFGFTFELVVGRTIGHIQLRLSPDTEKCPDIDPAMLGWNKPGARPELRGKLRCDALKARSVEKIGLIKKH